MVRNRTGIEEHHMKRLIDYCYTVAGWPPASTKQAFLNSRPMDHKQLML
jgi:hypothetical protein